MKDRSHDEAMAELFNADPSYANELLAEICREGCDDELHVLKRQLSLGSSEENDLAGSISSE